MAGRPPIKTAPEFGQRLAALRKARGWTQADLARQLGATIKTVAYFEREATNPTHKTVARFAAIFDVSPAELLGLSPDNSEPPQSKPGPPSKLEKLTAELAQLPRSKQRVVVDMLEGFLKQTNS